MTNISKCLAVLATVASLAFLGIVSVSAVGGPNYETDADSEDLRDVVFVKKVEDETGKVTWSVRTRSQRLTDPNNPNSGYQDKVIEQDTKVLARALIKSYKFLNEEQTRRIETKEKQIKDRQQQITEAQQLNTLDMKALENRIAGLQTRKAESETALKTIQDSVAAKQQTNQKNQAEAKRREEDITRFNVQIIEMVAERGRLETQRVKFAVLLEELQATVESLQRRNTRLRASASPAGTAPVANN